MVEVSGQWVEFSFFRPNAERVHVVGEFNDWRSNELPMMRGPDGYWRMRLRLPAGEFRFRYCADGEWYTDYAACGLEPSEFGLDSLLRVPEAPAQPVAVTASQAAA